VIGLANTGGRGSIVGGSVEESNVDIAGEFAKLIVAQQAYSANAKVVTTADQMLQTTLSMMT
jgi:flagellar hook protein FlgE